MKSRWGIIRVFLASLPAIVWAQTNCDSLTTTGRQLLFNGRVAEAMQLFNDALASDSTQTEAWYLRGVVLQRLSQFEEAEQNYADCRRVSADDARMNLAYAGLLIRMRELDRALVIAGEVLDNDEATLNECAEAHELMGIGTTAKVNMNRLSSAMNSPSKSIRLMPASITK